MNLPYNLGTRLGNINDLPKEIRENLSKKKTDTIESMIIEVLKELDGVGTIDEIFVGIYNHFKVAYKKQTIGTKLSVMFTKKIITKPPNKNGIYMLKDYEIN